MKKILAFRTDKMGKYLIILNILKQLKINYGHLTVVCSKTNYKLIKSQSFIDKIINNEILTDINKHI
jgi:ADP-heptose:LPS heptosyltransferase